MYRIELEIRGGYYEDSMAAAAKNTMTRTVSWGSHSEAPDAKFREMVNAVVEEVLRHVGGIEAEDRAQYERRELAKRLDARKPGQPVTEAAS